MITKDMVRAGFEAGIVRLDMSPNGDGVVCFIGENWFYFGGMTAEEADSVAEYVRNVPAEDIVNSIYEVLDDFCKHPEMFDVEYGYYDAFLQEQLDALRLVSQADKAEAFIAENPVLAREIFWAMDKAYYREDIVSRLVDQEDDFPHDFSEEEIDKLAERFKRGLEHNDHYWDCYWATADEVIREMAKEKAELARQTPVDEVLRGAYKDSEQASPGISKDYTRDMA